MSALLDALGYVGDSFDKLGGRELRGALGGKYRELASIIPFSDRVGITDPHDIVTGRNLTDKWGWTDKGDQGWGAWGTGLAADMVLDPATLLGGAGLAAKGFKGLRGAGKLAASVAEHAGPRIESVASRLDPAMIDRIGPRYNTPPEHLSNALMQFRNGRWGRYKNDIVGSILRSEDLPRIAHEFPPDAVPFGRGAERLAFHVPSDNSILSMGPADALGNGDLTRPNIPHVLQPARSVRYGDHIVERMPRVDPLLNQLGFGEMPQPKEISKLMNRLTMGNMDRSELTRGYRASEDFHNQARNAIEGMSHSIDAQSPGSRFRDSHVGNLSLTPGDRNLIVHDAGAVVNPLLPELQQSMPLPPPDLLSELLGQGAAEQARARIAQGLSTANQGIPLPQSFNLGQFEDARGLLADFINRYSPDFRSSGKLIQSTPASGFNLKPGVGDINRSAVASPSAPSVSMSGSPNWTWVRDSQRSPTTLIPAATPPPVRGNAFSRILRKAPETIKRHRLPLSVGAIGAGQFARSTRGLGQGG